MKYLLILTCVLAFCGCSQEYKTEYRRVTLDDGTECVVVVVFHERTRGITCDFD